MSARPGAVVLHGLTGSTQSVAGLAGALEDAGFGVEAPMLPGHGTTPEDLAGCGWDDWTAAAEAAYRRLPSPCVAVGLSMGGALAPGLAAAHPEVRGLAVVNPLIDPPAPAFLDALEGFLAAGERFLPGIGSDIADPSATEVAYDRLPVAALLSASRGLAELRARLGEVRCPVLILSSRHDHVVPSVSGDVLAEAVAGRVERVWLENSAHVATLDVDRGELERRIVAFASDLSGAPDGLRQDQRQRCGPQWRGNAPTESMTLKHVFLVNTSSCREDPRISLTIGLADHRIASMPHEADVELAETFAEVARALLDENDVNATLDRICELAAKTIDGCQAAGISVVEAKSVTSRSRTDELPLVVDRIQSETQEGPCVDAIKEHEVFLTGSLSEERRWPDFAHRAHDETGVESILSLRLFAREDTMGALNLYSRERDAFDDHDIAVGSVFAAHAAVAWSSAEREAQLRAKADSRDVIGMAKGIIIAQQKVSDDEAFDILRRASQRMNIKLRELAERIIERPPHAAPPTPAD